MGSVPQNRPATALLAKGSTGNPRTKAAAESAVRPAKEARRKSARQANRSPPRGSASPEIHTPKRRQRAFCFVESPENARPSSGFSASKPVRRGSSNGMVLPGKSAEPVGAHPAVAFRRGNTRRVRESFAPRGWTILRFVESPENAHQSSGFSDSKPGRHGSSSGRSSPGSRAPERRQRAFCFVESPENARQSSGFSASKPVRRGSSSGRVLPGRSAPSQSELVLRQRFRREATRWALGRPALRGRRFYVP